MTYDDDSIDWNTVPPAKMLHMVMQEIVDTRNELKQDITALDQKLSKRMDSLEGELRMFRREVHQNQTAFMANYAALDKRVTVLELAA